MSRMAPFMRASGADLCATVRVSKSGQMACDMTAIGPTVSIMAVVV